MSGFVGARISASRCAPVRCKTVGRQYAVRASAAGDRTAVAVTGAAGKTGALVVKKLLERKEKYEPRAVVRDVKSKQTATQLGVPESSVFVVDIATEGSKLKGAFEGAEVLVIATSAVPQIQPLSLIPVLWAKYVSKQEGVRPAFSWKAGQAPKQVDWEGQKAQIDAAKSAGVKQVILVSSMGGTQPDHPLNKIGDGCILKWKRKAEQYLVSSGLKYTIIHPGGLVDTPGGERELVVDVDDSLLNRETRNIPRADVAELVVQCIGLPAAMNRSVDVICLPKGEGRPSDDLTGLLTAMTKNCDYSIHSQMTEQEMETVTKVAA